MWFHRCDQCSRRRLVGWYYEVYPPIGSEGDESGWWWACADCLVNIVSDQLSAEDEPAPEPILGGHEVGQDWCDNFTPGTDGVHCATCNYTEDNH